MKPSLHIEEALGRVTTREFRRGIHVVSEPSTSSVRFYEGDQADHVDAPDHADRVEVASQNLGLSSAASDAAEI
jgi:hypothetical protein